MINAWWEDLTFTLQLPSTTGWRRAIDTGRPSPDDILDSGTEVALASTQYKVQARSVVVLVSR
jgi:glycogen operon protein